MMRRAAFLFLAPLLAAACGRSDGMIATAEADTAAGLSMDRPKDVHLRRGDSEQIVIRLHRNELPDAVMIRFGNLPSGVTVPDEDKGVLNDAAAFTLVASGSAAMVEGHPVTVTATSPHGPTAQETFDISVAR